MSSEDYPLITLHPVADSHHRWSGLLVQCEDSPSANSTQALVRLFGEFGLFEALGHLPCILPLTHPDTLDPELASLLPVEQVILRLATAHCANPDLADAITRFRSQGFRLLADGLPAADAVLPPAIQSLAIDCSPGTDVTAADAWIQRLAGPHLALHVEDGSGYEGLRGSGFRWIAGNYPLHPLPNKNPANNPGRAIMLKLLAQITSDADARDIEKTLKQDPQLSYQLLKLVNSVAFSLTTKISSFSQAITLLGRRQLQRWLQLLLYAHPHGSNDASPLMPRAAMRAGLMEGLARSAGCSKDVQDHAFMVGMFSLLEALIGLPAADVVKPLNLSGDVTTALVGHEGQLGAWLAAIEAAEIGPSDAARAALTTAGLSNAAWAAEQAQALHWAAQVSREA